MSFRLLWGPWMRAGVWAPLLTFLVWGLLHARYGSLSWTARDPAPGWVLTLAWMLPIAAADWAALSGLQWWRASGRPGRWIGPLAGGGAYLLGTGVCALVYVWAR